MRILHCCLSCFYIDGYSYQENVLPRMHLHQGHEILILASTETYIDGKRIGYIKPSRYVNCDGIPVHRIPYVKCIPHKLSTKLRIYQNVYRELCEFAPDLIFLHDVQFLSISKIAKYVKDHQDVRVIADGHADYINSAHGFVSRWILHGILYRWSIKKVVNYTEKFYGTLPARETFFKEVYYIPPNKVDLLTFGADDEIVQKVQNDGSRQKIRDKFGFKETDFVIVSGGKFNNGKRNIFNLMDAVIELNGTVKLLIFGSFDEDLQEDLSNRASNSHITIAGWASEEQSYQLMNASDLAVFPCLHSTLWEQAVGLGIPCIFQKLNGFTHVDLNGNCRLIDAITVPSILHEIQTCMDNFTEMKDAAKAQAAHFSYYHIAKKAIDG